jgi:hypothetical protein
MVLKEVKGTILTVTTRAVYVHLHKNMTDGQLLMGRSSGCMIELWVYKSTKTTCVKMQLRIRTLWMVAPKMNPEFVPTMLVIVMTSEGHTTHASYSYGENKKSYKRICFLD